MNTQGINYTFPRNFRQHGGRAKPNLPLTNFVKKVNYQHAPLSRGTSLTDILLQVHPNNGTVLTEQERHDQEAYLQQKFKINDKGWTFTGHRRKEATTFTLSSKLEDFGENNNQVARALNEVFGTLQTNKVSEIKRGKDKTNVSLKLNIVEKLTSEPDSVINVFENSEPNKSKKLKEYFKGKEYNHLTSAQKHLLELLNRAIPAKTKARDAVGYAERTRNRLEHLDTLKAQSTTITLEDLANAFLFVLKGDRDAGSTMRELKTKTSISDWLRAEAEVFWLLSQSNSGNVSGGSEEHRSSDRDELTSAPAQSTSALPPVPYTYISPRSFCK